MKKWFENLSGESQIVWLMMLFGLILTIIYYALKS